MTQITGFPPIANSQARILILGSMPSEKSLQQQQYYAHPRNAFWPIMLAIFQPQSQRDTLSYEQAKAILLEQHIAVWDVLQSCYRQGSLDTAIKMDSIQVNDFHWFLSQQPDIRKICFNGAKAEQLFNKYVLPSIQNQYNDMEYCRLPSTSPANAAMKLEQKHRLWVNSLKEHRL